MASEGEQEYRPEPGMPTPGEVLAGRYRIEAPIGSGSSSVVFEATQLATHKRVALKWLVGGESASERARERFLREGQAAARIDDPGVVRVHDFGEARGGSYLVMELLEGESLRTRMSRGRLPEREAAMLLMPALLGLSAAHARGVVHRDLKPENIFLCATDALLPRAKVLDFGFSKLVDGQGGRLTRTGIVVGTPRYMSPEQAQALPIDARSDVYATGVMLYEMVAGCLPFGGETVGEHLAQVMRGKPTPLRTHRPEVSARFEQVVMRAIARDPADRFADMDSLARALQPADPAAGDTPARAPGSGAPGPLREQDGGAPDDASEELLPLPRTRKPVIVAAGALALLLVGLLVWALSGRSSGADEGPGEAVGEHLAQPEAASAHAPSGGRSAAADGPVPEHPPQGRGQAHGGDVGRAPAGELSPGRASAVDAVGAADALGAAEAAAQPAAAGPVDAAEDSSAAALPRGRSAEPSSDAQAGTGSGAAAPAARAAAPKKAAASARAGTRAAIPDPWGDGSGKARALPATPEAVPALAPARLPAPPARQRVPAPVPTSSP